MWNPNTPQQTKAPTAEVRSPSGGLLGFKQRLLGRNRCGSQTPQPSSDIVGFPAAEIEEAIGKQQQHNKQQQARKRNASRRATQQAPLRNRNNSYNANNPKDSGAEQSGEATPGDGNADGEGTVPLLRSEPEPDADPIQVLRARNLARLDKQRHDDQQLVATATHRGLNYSVVPIHSSTAPSSTWSPIRDHKAQTFDLSTPRSKRAHSLGPGGMMDFDLTALAELGLSISRGADEVSQNQTPSNSSVLAKIHDTIGDGIIEVATDVAVGCTLTAAATALGATGGQMVAENFADTNLAGMGRTALGSIGNYIGGAAGALGGAGAFECARRATRSSSHSRSASGSNDTRLAPQQLQLQQTPQSQPPFDVTGTLIQMSQVQHSQLVQAQRSDETMLEMKSGIGAIAQII